MLVSLSIRDVVLIDRLNLALSGGLCVLTGETGAGKSILLDALGLALGNRADAALLRPGAARAVVSAAFEVPHDHPANRILAARDMDAGDGPIVLRRVLGADGRGRAFVNDEPVSVGLLRRLGDALVEVQGQFEQRGLLDTATHRALLDAYGGLSDAAARVAAFWRAWRDAVQAREAAAREIEAARREDAYLRHAVAELDALDPRPGEEEALAEERAVLMNADKLLEALDGALGDLAGGGDAPGAATALAAARRRLERIAQPARARLAPVLAALGRAAVETEEALGALQSVSNDIDQDPGKLERVETRYFALRELARKHDTDVESLARLRDDLAARLAGIEEGGARLRALEQAAVAARAAYVDTAGALAHARRDAAKDLDRAVTAELPPLKLDKATFATRFDRLDEPDWGADGLDRMAFQVATNPGVPPGPLARVASGGELARFLLAIKVVLAGVGPARTLIFDEVDSGIGGATAHAVGERLQRLTRDRQVLVVTHSPQVGARAAHHWRVHKATEGTGAGARVTTRVSPLDPDQRTEEIARMLAGAEITDEARAAARRLIEAEAP